MKLTTIKKIKVVSVTMHDPSVHMMPQPFSPNRIFLSVIGEEYSESMLLDRAMTSYARVKIKTEEGEKDAEILPVSVKVPHEMRNPMVISLSPEEYEGLGRPTVGDTVEVTIHKLTGP